MSRYDIDGRMLLLSILLCAFAAAATPYIVLKLGMSTDLTFGAVFLGGTVLSHLKGRELGIQLNLLQTMVNTTTGIGFMCVILGAFHLIQQDQDIGFHLAWWQISVWTLLSSLLGVFLGAMVRRFVLDDTTLTWPTGMAMSGLLGTLTAEDAAEKEGNQRKVLLTGTWVTALLTYLRDGFGVLPTFVGNPAINLALGVEFMALGTGLLLPLVVGLSGLIGVWCIATFGDHLSLTVATHAVPAAMQTSCLAALDTFQGGGEAAGAAKTLLTTECGRDMAKYVGSTNHFGLLIKWFMWPATSLMISASLTSVVKPLLSPPRLRTEGSTSLANEEISPVLLWGGFIVSAAFLAVLQSAWFQMPILQMFVVILIQPLLVIAGLRVLAITGNGPVSLMANATQFAFGLLWPNHILQNLAAAQVSADPQASSENTGMAFWVARKIGGNFRTLLVVQLIAAPIGALFLPFTFNWLVSTYGIGTDPGQLSAPTSQKIAALAIVMKDGLSAMPLGAITASILAAIAGVVLELGCMAEKTGSDGTIVRRFAWMPVPAAIGFGMLLPPSVTISLAIGSIVAYVWRQFSDEEKGSYATYVVPIAVALIAGEALVGAIVLPLLTTLVGFVL